MKFKTTIRRVEGSRLRYRRIEASIGILEYGGVHTVYLELLMPTKRKYIELAKKQVIYRLTRHRLPAYHYGGGPMGGHGVKQMRRG